MRARGQTHLLNDTHIHTHQVKSNTVKKHCVSIFIFSFCYCCCFFFLEIFFLSSIMSCANVHPPAFALAPIRLVRVRFFQLNKLCKNIRQNLFKPESTLNSHRHQHKSGQFSNSENMSWKSAIYNRNAQKTQKQITNWSNRWIKIDTRSAGALESINIQYTWTWKWSKTN